MFGTIRKHQNWLWAVIIVVIVISFVIYFSPDAKWGGRGGRGSGELGTIDGQSVTVHDYQQAYRETRLLYFLNFQKWPDSDERARQMGFDVDNEAYMRLIRLAKVKQEKIAVSDETVATLARRLLGPKLTLDAFVKEILAPHGINEADFERFLRNDAAIQQLGAVAGLPGKLIPPRELEAAYREDHEEVALDLVSFNVSNYLAGVTVAEPALLQWYSNSAAMFRIPEKARVSYIEFHHTNFLAEIDKKFAEITNLNTQLEQVWQKQGPDTFKDKEGKVLSKEAALEKIKTNERKAGALHLAALKANDFAGRLYDQTNHTLAGFESFAAAQGYKSRVSEPFDEENGLQEIKVPDEFARAALNLTNKEEAVAFKPMTGEDACYVFALKEIIPSANPKFEDIRAKVVERYKFAEAQKLARQAGMNFQAALTNGLAQGKTFTQLVTDSNLKSVSLPHISRSVRELPDLPENLYLPQLKGVAFGYQGMPGLESGKASSYIPSMGGGYILYLRSKLPIDETKMKTDLAEYAANVRMQRQNEAFGSWFREQAKRADLPINRPKQGAAPKSIPPAPKAKAPRAL